MEKVLEYYFQTLCHVIFNRYTIDTSGIVRDKLTDELIRTRIVKKYNVVDIIDNNGNKRRVRIARAIASTYLGAPPSSKHTADHIDRNSLNDILNNIRWADLAEQSRNRTMPSSIKSSFVVVKDDIEKTVNNWVAHLKDQKNHMSRGYTAGMIKLYAQKKQHGFSYKEYPDIPGEIWKKIEISISDKGHREISNMNRVKFVTKHAENVIENERLNLSSDGYPRIIINGVGWDCHVLSFMMFYPKKYAEMRTNEMILHEDDNKLDFRPHKLRIGTRSENTIDAYNNGIYDGAKSGRLRCASYINDVLEKEHESQHDAVKYLKTIGFDKASASAIGRALKTSCSGKVSIRYGRTWKKL